MNTSWRMAWRSWCADSLLLTSDPFNPLYCSPLPRSTPSAFPLSTSLTHPCSPLVPSPHLSAPLCSSQSIPFSLPLLSAHRLNSTSRLLPLSLTPLSSSSPLYSSLLPLHSVSPLFLQHSPLNRAAFRPLWRMARIMPSSPAWISLNPFARRFVFVAVVRVVAAVDRCVV